MSTKKKIVLSVLLGVLIVMGVYTIVILMDWLIVNNIGELLKNNYDGTIRNYYIKNIIIYCIMLLFGISSVVLEAIFLIKLIMSDIKVIVQTVSFNKDEYIKKRKDIKLQKLKEKQEKIQEKIQETEKTE